MVIRYLSDPNKHVHTALYSHKKSCPHPHAFFHLKYYSPTVTHDKTFVYDCFVLKIDSKKLYTRGNLIDMELN